jgi:tetratricopeptide (TPR) repeat protein
MNNLPRAYPVFCLLFLASLSLAETPSPGSKAEEAKPTEEFELKLPKEFDESKALSKLKALYATDPKLAIGLTKIRQAEDLEDLHRYDEAEAMLTEVDQLVEATLGKGSEQSIMQLDNHARLLIRIGKTDRAEALLRTALEIAIKAGGAQSNSTFVVMNSLVSAYIKQGKQKDALELQANLIAGKEGKFGKTSVEVADTYSSAAFVFNRAEREKEGEVYAQKSIKILEELKQTDGDNYTAALNSLGTSYLGQRRFAEAEGVFHRTLDLIQKQYGENSDEIGGLINNLAVAINSVAEIQDDKKRKDEAEAMYQRSLAIAEKRYGVSHPSVATTLYNISLTLISHTKLKEAESMLRRAVQIYDEKLPKGDAMSIAARMQMVSVIQMLGRVTEAEKYGQETLAQAEAATGPESTAVADVLHSLGGLLARLNRSVESEQSYWRAFKIREKVLGPDHVDVARSLNNVALLVQLRGDYKNPESMFRRVLKINQKHYGEKDVRVGQDVLKLANNLKLQKRWDEAEAEIRHAADIYIKTFGEDHPMIANVEEALAEVLREQKKFPQQEAALRNSLKIRQKSLGDRHPEAADTMFKLCLVLHHREKYLEAEALGREAYLIFISLPANKRPDDRYMGMIRDIYQIILRDLRYPRNLEFDRLDALHNGVDPGPLPGYNT